MSKEIICIIYNENNTRGYVPFNNISSVIWNEQDGKFHLAVSDRPKGFPLVCTTVEFLNVDPEKGAIALGLSLIHI